MSIPATSRSYLVGIVLLLGAAVGWSLSGAIIKLAYAGGTGPDGVTIAFYRSLFAGVCVWPLARGKFGTLRSATAPAKLLRIRLAAVGCVIFFTLMTASFVVANTLTESSNVIILQYTSTFWVFSLSPKLLGESPRRGDVWILALAMIGIAVIFGGRFGAGAAGLLIALGSGLFFGLLTIMIRLMRNADSAAVTVLNMLGSALLLLPFVLLFGTGNLSSRTWILLVFLGIVQFGFPYFLYSLALKRVPAYHAAFVTLTEPLLNPLWTYLAVGEKVPLATMVGGGVIMLALALFIVSAQRRTRWDSI